ncbi:hypothetical protein N7537_005402 [Penicillium hordei]|uniref:Uncharacterized protein n=1 Tax=Penicillium hordei TaxID=40994 RepID=A0AAD6E618_9EURO|nr:uncharacterized protein N7537_005402 [Penicillium hordei]KAJ5602446.1 hypothetical protein N7537_005402 [Penicillium hordei]
MLSPSLVNKQRKDFQVDIAELTQYSNLRAPLKANYHVSLVMTLNRRNKTSNPEPDNNHLDSTRTGYRNSTGANPMCDSHRIALCCSGPWWFGPSDYNKNERISLYGDLVADPYY